MRTDWDCPSVCGCDCARIEIERLHVEAERLHDAVDHVLRVFEKDEAQGYRSKDRQFAIEILRKAQPRAA